MRVVLDTCILKLATFTAENNASALIYELARAGFIEAWVSPAILEENAHILEAALAPAPQRAGKRAPRAPLPLGASQP